MFTRPHVQTLPRFGCFFDKATLDKLIGHPTQPSPTPSQKTRRKSETPSLRMSTLRPSEPSRAAVTATHLRCFVQAGVNVPVFNTADFLRLTFSDLNGGTVVLVWRC